ncbi:hypothetical protein [Streptomyces sp. NPDC058613]|uniref:hypothetical protein n=1 Tax=unclassified Streptomyces TaxID=2593676 RepID=UPI00364F96A0
MVRRIVGIALGLVLAGIATLLMVQVAHHRYVWAYFIAMPLYLAAVFCAGAPFFDDADVPGGESSDYKGDGGVGLGL